MIELSVFPKTFFGVEVPKDLNEKVKGLPSFNYRQQS